MPQGEAEVICRSRGKVANEDKFKFRLAELRTPRIHHVECPALEDKDLDLGREIMVKEGPWELSKMEAWEDNELIEQEGKATAEVRRANFRACV